MSRSSLLLFSALSLLLFLIPLAATSSVIETTATTANGAPLTVDVTLDDGVDPGKIVITLDVSGGNIGDLRGFFANVTDEGLLDKLSVSGFDVSDSAFEANSVRQVGGGNNLNGSGTPCPCDLGIEFGSPGTGRDDLQSVTFTLSHVDGQPIDASLFADQTFGVRATSVGPLHGSRDGSSKLIGVIPVIPEPSTAMLMALGLLGLAIPRQRAERAGSA